MGCVTSFPRPEVESGRAQRFHKWWVSRDQPTTHTNHTHEPSPTGFKPARFLITEVAESSRLAPPVLEHLYITHTAAEKTQPSDTAHRDALHYNPLLRSSPSRAVRSVPYVRSPAHTTCEAPAMSAVQAHRPMHSFLVHCLSRLTSPHQRHNAQLPTSTRRGCRSALPLDGTRHAHMRTPKTHTHTRCAPKSTTRPRSRASAAGTRRIHQETLIGRRPLE